MGSAFTRSSRGLFCTSRTGVSARASSWLQMMAAFLFLLAESAGATLYWTEIRDGDGAVVRADNDGNVEQELVGGSNIVAGLAVDSHTRQVYFVTDVKNIERVEDDGTGRTLVYSQTGRGFIFNLDVDPVNQNIYFGTFNTGPDLIARTSYSGGPATTVADAQTNIPDGVFADPAGGFVYWIEQIGVLRRAPIGGGVAQTLVTRSGTDVELDLGRGHIYYSATNSIHRCDLDGENDIEIVALTTDAFGLALNVREQIIYWAELRSGNIRRATFDGDNIETIASGLYQPRDLEFVPDPALAVPVLSAWAIVVLVILMGFTLVYGSRPSRSSRPG